VILRESDEDNPSDYEFIPFLATVCPYEAQAYMDSSEERVEVIAMPPDMTAWVATFVETHHVDQKFRKRRRDEVPGGGGEA
jgi:hypothetical protein